MSVNFRIERLQLDTLAVGEARFIPVDQVQNLTALRVSVGEYARRRGIKLSVHLNKREGEVEIARRVMEPDVPIGETRKALPRRY